MHVHYLCIILSTVIYFPVGAGETKHECIRVQYVYALMLCSYSHCWLYCRQQLYRYFIASHLFNSLFKSMCSSLFIWILGSNFTLYCFIVTLYCMFFSLILLKKKKNQKSLWLFFFFFNSYVLSVIHRGQSNHCNTNNNIWKCSLTTASWYLFKMNL